ncbi:alpha/beta-hydrolase [Pluteus cervinus]|uniref:Alpha/beta-hydrolase n=1 Tax=Pluteus cervinus TaxID=181527 RepID=A0ACD3A534_9AGAR|nr:alpha/beta-hydrolase [Pluteus cervinus]
MTLLFPAWIFRSKTSIHSESSLPLFSAKEVLPLSLDYFSTPGGPPPPSARVHHKVKYQPRPHLGVCDVWKYGYIVASKAIEITSDVLLHSIRGPRRKSWGIEMTVISAFMRGLAQHSSLVDLMTIRLFMSLGGLAPLPSDALVTPLTFRVRKHNLRGFLAKLDAAETGSRKLSGEWVVGRSTWQRLQTEWNANSNPTEGNAKFRQNHKERVVYYVHGGGFYSMSAAALRSISIPLSKHTDSRVFALDYRLAPETIFPGPLHDVVCGYLRLIDDLQIPPQNVILCGDSAGGGLCLALLMYLRDNAYPAPSGAILMSPWVDLTMSCESWASNCCYDIVPFPSVDNHLHPILLYLGERLEQYLTHPYASPLFGDLTGLPPLLLQSGDAEVLRDEIILFAHKAKLAGVEICHEMYADCVHASQIFPFLPTTQQAFMSIRRYVRDILPKIQLGSPQPLKAIAERGLASELVSDKATVVRGDGVVTDIGMDGVLDKLGGVQENFGEGQDIYGVANQRNLPSWGPILPITSMTDSKPAGDVENGEDGEEIKGVSNSASRPKAPARTNTMSGIRHMGSAVSFLVRSASGNGCCESASDEAEASPAVISSQGSRSSGPITPDRPTSSPPRRSGSLSHADIQSSLDSIMHVVSASILGQFAI